MDLTSSTGCCGGEYWGMDLAGIHTTQQLHHLSSVALATFLPLSSKCRLLMRKGMDLNQTPPSATQERMVKFYILKQFPSSFSAMSFSSLSCVSLSLSTIGGSYRCGCCNTEQHCHQGDLGSNRERDSQRKPAWIQGTGPVFPLLFELTYSALVLMNTYFVFTTEVARF